MSLFPITCAVKCLLGTLPNNPRLIRQKWGDYPTTPDYFTRVNSATPKIYLYQRSPSNLIQQTDYKTKLIKGTGPVSVVYVYNPGPPLFPGGPSYETPPNPNGQTGDGTKPDQGVANTMGYLPRAGNDAPYDFTALSSPPFRDAHLMPVSGTRYTVESSSTGSTLNLGSIVSPGYGPCGSWSLKGTVSNLQSRVLNQQTQSYEYYDFNQQTFEYEQTGLASVNLTSIVCCWNDGMTITGKVSFKSIPFTTEARPGTNENGYGFGGMFIDVDGDWSDAGQADWSLTINDNTATPAATIEVPLTEGVITVVSDFWVTNITGP